MDSDLWQYPLKQIYITAPLGDQDASTESGLISHSVTLSWHWANQSFPYPNNAKHLARKRQALINHWFDSTGNKLQISSTRRPPSTDSPTASNAPLEDQTASTMTWFPRQSHYPDTALTSPYPTLVVLSHRLGLTRPGFKLPTFHTGSLHSIDSSTVSGASGQTWVHCWKAWIHNPHSGKTMVVAIRTLNPMHHRQSWTRCPISIALCLSIVWPATYAGVSSWKSLYHGSEFHTYKRRWKEIQLL